MSDYPSPYQTMTARERACHDPQYLRLVESMRALLRDRVFSAGDLLSAVDLAIGLNDEQQPLYPPAPPIPETPPRE